MDYHQHVRLTIFSRERLAKQVMEEGLTDHSSRPHRLRQMTTPELATRVEVLRRERWTGQRIAQQTGLSWVSSHELRMESRG